MMTSILTEKEQDCLASQENSAWNSNFLGTFSTQGSYGEKKKSSVWCFDDRQSVCFTHGAFLAFCFFQR